MRTTSVTGWAGDHRLTIHVHPGPDAAERCRYDQGPEAGALALEKYPGDS